MPLCKCYYYNYAIYDQLANYSLTLLLYSDGGVYADVCCSISSQVV